MNANPKRVVAWVLVLTVPVAAGAVLSGLLLFFPPDLLLDVATKHFAAVVGLPLAALLAAFVVVALHHAAGPLKFEGLGFKFERAARVKWSFGSSAFWPSPLQFVFFGVLANLDAQLNVMDQRHLTRINRLGRTGYGSLILWIPLAFTAAMVFDAPRSTERLWPWLYLALVLALPVAVLTAPFFARHHLSWWRALRNRR